MNEEYFVTAKTVEEAMALAASKYAGEDVSYEIVEMPKKGFLGIGSSPAKIKVTINKEEEIDLTSIVSSVKDMKVSTNKGGAGDSRGAEKHAERPEKSDKSDKFDKFDKKEKKSAEKHSDKIFEKNSEKTAKAEAHRAAKPAMSDEGASAQKSVRVEGAPIKKEPHEIVVTQEEKDFALEFVTTLLRDMEVNAEAAFEGTEVAGETGNTYPRLVISGEGAGILIGHHGETLDAIQHLVNLSALRRSGNTQKEFVKIVVDIEGYREKREETLRALARRMAAKASKYKRNVLLEPMNPYERRIIHSELQGFENISTHSVGSDDNRKIVITYEGADKIDRRPRRAQAPSEQE